MMNSDAELRPIIAKNLIHYRKLAGFTQAALAEKLNYSDKSISKWERGEGVPDIFVLAQLAELYGITVSDFLSPNQKTLLNDTRRFKLIATLLCGAIVWLIAVIAFVGIKLVATPIADRAYLAFIYAIPTSALVLAILMRTWDIKSLACIFTSIIEWGVLLSLFLSFRLEKSWLLFIVGIPIQIIIILGQLLYVEPQRLARIKEKMLKKEPNSSHINVSKEKSKSKKAAKAAAESLSQPTTEQEEKD